MGAWSTDNFGNDDAMDFLFAVEDEGLLALTSAIQTAQNELASGYLEAPAACSIIAAGEVVATAFGRPSPDFPDDAKRVATQLSIPKHFAGEILVLLTSILEGGELKELWDESEDAARWKDSVENLIERLK